MLTHERLCEVCDYEPQSGALIWRYRYRSKMKPGDIAGAVNGAGYRVVRIDSKIYLAHRLVWFWVYGSFPRGDLDHRNGLRDDNRLENLREATPSQNGANRKNAYNYNGLKGASRCKGRLWQATIHLHGKGIYLGNFQTEAQAHAAYIEAARRIYGEFARAV